jgi:hypothetical protein
MRPRFEWREAVGDCARHAIPIRKTIQWSSTTTMGAEARAMEVKLIREHRANDPTIGYNRWPASP